MKKDHILSLNKDDFIIEAFPAGGPGGQHQNKTSSAVRIKHKESGAFSESKTHRSQHANRKAAFNRLMKNPKFKVWLSRRIFEINSGKTIDQMVTESLTPSNIKIEIKDGGKWIESDDLKDHNTRYDYKSGKMVYDI